MTEQKEYWIRLFINKCTSLTKSEADLEFYLDWCKRTYGLSMFEFKEMQEKYDIEEYLKRIIPVIDKYFSIDDIKAIIKFYSTDYGKKLIDHTFLKEMGEVGKDMNMEIEQDFSLRSIKK